MIGALLVVMLVIVHFCPHKARFGSYIHRKTNRSSRKYSEQYSYATQYVTNLCRPIEWKTEENEQMIVVSLCCIALHSTEFNWIELN